MRLTLWLTILLTISAFAVVNWALARHQPAPHFEITAIRTCANVNTALAPIQTQSSFPTNSPRIFCWFQWENAKPNTAITAQWYHDTTGSHILDSHFRIPLAKGRGSVSLSLPKNSAFPAGDYRCNLVIDGNMVRSVRFKVQPAQP